MPGASVKSASAVVLTASDMHAHNTFEQPNVVQPQKLDVSVAADLLTVSLPAASVARLEITLG